MNFGKLYETLSKEQQEEAKRCQTPEQLKEFFAKHHIDITEEFLASVDGGAAASAAVKSPYGSYCPYTIDRTCKLGCGFDNENEECLYCGWRAW